VKRQRPWSLEEIRRTLRPALEASGAKQAIVFGSHARGEADAWSDLDLVIVADCALPFPDRFRAFPRVFEAYPHALDLLVYTPAEFAGMVAVENPFLQRVLREGKVIHEKQG